MEEGGLYYFHENIFSKDGKKLQTMMLFNTHASRVRLPFLTRTYSPSMAHRRTSSATRGVRVNGLTTTGRQPLGPVPISLGLIYYTERK